MLYGRYNYSFHRAYFMVYKPTNITGGPHPVGCGPFLTTPSFQVTEMDVLTHLLESIEQRLAASEASTAELRQLLARQAPAVPPQAPGPWTAAGNARWKNRGKTAGKPWEIHVICGEHRRLWRRSGENMVSRSVKLGRYCKNNWKMLRKAIFSYFWSWIVCCFVGWRMDEIWPCQLSSLLSSWSMTGECSPRWIWGITAWYFKIFQALKWGISWLLRWVKG